MAALFLCGVFCEALIIVVLVKILENDVSRLFVTDCLSMIQLCRISTFDDAIIIPHP